MSRREFMELNRRKGATVEICNERQWAAEEKLREKLDRHPDKFCGNPNWPPHLEYKKELARLNAGIYKTVYYMRFDRGTSQEITKAEFDYFHTL